MRSSTDLHWNRRAEAVENDAEVNLADLFQRDLELDFICRRLVPEMTVVEAGCGNGWSTARFRDRVRHVDAFDLAPAMIERARSRFGETNNRFIQDDVLSPVRLAGPYDAAICVRVLINLQDLNEQHRAIDSISRLVKPGGLLLLAEGFSDGFRGLTELREQVGLPSVRPASINFYSSLGEVLPAVENAFSIEETFHLGAYDYLTRVLYPLVAGVDNAKHNTVFSEKCARLAKFHNPDSFERFSRMRGLVCRRRIR